MQMQKIYVGNLPYSVTEQGLDELFAQFGTIETVVLITDRATGRSKGFGFITFTNPSEAQAALKMDGHNLDGRPLKVSIAEERARKPQRPRSDRDRGDRGRY